MKYLLITLFPFYIFGQPNCQGFKDKNCKKACEISIKAEANQWGKESQELFDESLKLCPSIYFSWKEKAVPYLKTGDFITWAKLMDKAVEYNPTESLGYRGWCRYQFFRDYKGAIHDIELLDSLVNYNIGFSQNGDYHLNIAKALCYSGLGQNHKAIQIIENQLKTENYDAGYYDYYQLGVTYFKVKDFKNALRCFEKQVVISDLAENEYYLGKIYKLQDNLIEYKKHKEIALTLYKGVKKLRDPYTHHFNKVYLETIEAE